MDGRMKFQEVVVDGVKGHVISSREHGPGRPLAYNLIWIRDGILYSFMGHGSTEDALTIANSM
jgi:hypothetical protein